MSALLVADVASSAICRSRGVSAAASPMARHGAPAPPAAQVERERPGAGGRGRAGVAGAGV